MKLLMIFFYRSRDNKCKSSQKYTKDIIQSQTFLLLHVIANKIAADIYLAKLDSKVVFKSASIHMQTFYSIATGLAVQIYKLPSTFLRNREKKPPSGCWYKSVFSTIRHYVTF